MIHTLPSCFTTLNLLCGFYSIISSINGDFTKASWAIFLAIVFDIFDGRIARLLDQTTRFGLEYDSLCDLVSFGVAPSVLMYQYVLSSFGKIGWLAAFLYTACVALRLARFNTRTHAIGINFEGLPSPAAAAFIASGVLLAQALEISLKSFKWVILMVIGAISYLLISSIEYPSFKKLKVGRSYSFYFLVFFVLGLTFVAYNPPFSVFIIVTFYIAISPFLFFKRGGFKFVKKIWKKKN